MSETSLRLKKLVNELSAEDRRFVLDLLRSDQPIHPLEAQWRVGAETILTAIGRSSDLTRRGVRGVIAEAIFQEQVVPTVSGWDCIPVLGNCPFDFLFESEGIRARVQVKLQRLKEGRPMSAREGSRLYPAVMHTVEVQRTRGGRRGPENVDTRPYRFGEFDILAVNLHPSTGKWRDFLYTVATWLVPRVAEPHLIGKFQPVPLAPTEAWTDDLSLCLDWFRSGRPGRIFEARPAG